MIKNIIFDVDNTIFDSSVENAIYYKEALENLGYNSERYLELYNSIDGYESTFSENDNFYKKEKMLELINKVMDENYDIKLIDEINEVIAKYWINKVYLEEETLKYLHQKYNLYVFSNWFYDAPYNRLKNVGYLKYFKKIFTSDEYGSKPYKTSFERILNEINARPEECVMIGDSLKSDVNGALNAGLNAIWFNRQIISNENKGYIEINDLGQLKKFL